MDGIAGGENINNGLGRGGCMKDGYNDSKRCDLTEGYL